MIEKGSLVVFKNMEREHGTGFRKPWMNGMCGVVQSYTKVSNVYNGKVSEICSVDLITPVQSINGSPITRFSGVHVQNLDEIERKPIKKIKREPVISK